MRLIFLFGINTFPNGKIYTGRFNSKPFLLYMYNGKNMIQYKDDYKKTYGIQTFDNGDLYELSHLKMVLKHGKGKLKKNYLLNSC